MNAMTNTDTSSGNVVAFRRPADDAVGRDRRRAARVITHRLRELAASADFRVQHPGRVVDLRVGGLSVCLAYTAYGMYFRIDGQGSILMSGYVDPAPPGQYDEGRLHVMSWKRGWEGELFRTASQRPHPV